MTTTTTTTTTTTNPPAELPAITATSLLAEEPSLGDVFDVISGAVVVDEVDDAVVETVVTVEQSVVHTFVSLPAADVLSKSELNFRLPVLVM